MMTMTMMAAVVQHLFQLRYFVIGTARADEQSKQSQIFRPLYMLKQIIYPHPNLTIRVTGMSLMEADFV